MDEALEFAIDQLESLLLAANSGDFDDDDDRRRCEQALQQLTAERDTCPGVKQRDTYPGVKQREPMHPEYHAEDPFKIIERIGEVFVLTHYPASSEKDYAIWRATLHIEGRPFVGEGTSPEYAIRECIQKYVLAFPEGHHDT